MKLIDLLVQHLGSNGRWPIGAGVCAQDNDGEVCFYANSHIRRGGNNLVWLIQELGENRVVKRRIFMKQAEDMAESIITRDQYEAALAASQQPAWNGDGLPPVGCECEVKRVMDWMKCKILFISEHHVVLKSKEEICWQTQSCQFRPMRTEAERKREETIKEITRHVTNFNKTDVTHAIIEIYDAIAAGEVAGIKLDGDE